MKMSRKHWVNFSLFGTNIYLISRMNWLDFVGQRYRSLWPRDVTVSRRLFQSSEKILQQMICDNDSYQGDLVFKACLTWAPAARTIPPMESRHRWWLMALLRQTGWRKRWSWRICCPQTVPENDGQLRVSMIERSSWKDGIIYELRTEHARESASKGFLHIWDKNPLRLKDEQVSHSLSAVSQEHLEGLTSNFCFKIAVTSQNTCSITPKFMW